MPKGSSTKATSIMLIEIGMWAGVTLMSLNSSPNPIEVNLITCGERGD